MRHAVVLIHRYLGLTMALFLIVAGLTGSIMAFENEIDAWLNPQLFKTETRGQALSPARLVEQIEREDPRVRVSYLSVVRREGETVQVSVRAKDNLAAGKPYELGFNQLFADPVTGTIVGTRQSGLVQLDREHFIPLVVKLHYSLFLPGSWGVWLFGAVALLWTIDCFIGLWLTFPRGRPFMQKWAPAWQIKPKRFNFDMHRAGGLWMWAVLLILAVSSVSLNLYSEVFRPVVALFSPITSTPFDTREVRSNYSSPAFDYDKALAIARSEGLARHIEAPPDAIGHRPERGFYFASYRKTDGRTESGLSRVRLYFDDQTGEVIGERGTQKDSAGDVFAQLQYPLHSGRIAGVAGRTLICLVGILVVVLSVTGLVIWWRKQRAHAHRRLRTIPVGTPSDSRVVLTPLP